MDETIRRIERDIEDLAVRIRALETLESSQVRQVLGEFRQVQQKVNEIELRGTRITVERIVELRRSVDALATRITRIEDARGEDVKRSFRLLISAIISIIVAVVSAILIAIATRPPT